MTFRFALLSLLISSSVFSQSADQVDAPEGVYSTFDDFRHKKPTMSTDVVTQNLMKNQYGNFIIVQDDLFSAIWGIVLKGNLYIRRTSKMKSSDLPTAVIPINNIVVSVSKRDVAFVRVIKYGKICLNAENDMIKLPLIDNYRVSVSNFKYLIEDDKELTSSYKKEKDKEIKAYRYIDLYNAKHPIPGE